MQASTGPLLLDRRHASRGTGMGFKVDENLPIEVAQMLRQTGHDAVTVLEQRRGGSVDAQLAALRQREAGFW